MSPHGTFPLHLVNQVIDELGDPRRRNNADDALHACALVSKGWTTRSRAHPFKEISIEVRDGQPTITPPTPLLPYTRNSKYAAAIIPNGYPPSQTF